jgi:hypothetical protein
MLVDGVTINVAGDWSVGFCAAAISVDNSITGMHSKTIEASRRVAMTANMNVGANPPSIAFRGHDTSKRGPDAESDGGRVDEEVAHPHPSQTRICRFPASGSSWESISS